MGAYPLGTAAASPTEDARDRRPKIFISYSRREGPFVEILRERLDAIGFDVWWDLQHAPSGEIHSVVRRAVAECDAAILVLSRGSTRWVKYEAQLILEREETLGRPLLCPIALDARWRDGWKPPLRSWIEEYIVLDFSSWSRPDTFSAQFRKLVRGLGTHYELVAPATRRRPLGRARVDSESAYASTRRW